jgi:aubergine-like protein
MSDLHQSCGRDLARFRESVFSKLIGSIVLTRYNNKTYKVDDILWEANPMYKTKYSKF